MTVELCLGWARDGAEIADPYTWARRLDSLRPTAMHLLQSGVDISVIALWLGHESPATTFIYLSADMKMKEEALLRLQPTVIGTKRFKASDDLLAFLKGL
jgi:integrase